VLPVVFFLQRGALLASGACGGPAVFLELPGLICGMVGLLLPLVRCCFGNKVSDVFDLNKFFNQMIKTYADGFLIN
jgi:hypothetical protein